ncbi:MAG: hypothetical protein HRT36_01680, partial [Alphaproteobacteria bacterium]|nr:hypothetical protein [Alphaproteobacteria bacterium]
MIATNWRCFSRSFAVVVVLGVLLFLGSAYGRLDVGFSARTDQAEVNLLAALQGLDTKQQEVLFGLEFVLQPGWKIYWRALGAGGKPPELHWHEGSQNIAGLTIQWPFPQRFRTYGLLSNGYGGRVILPLLVQRQDPSQPMTLDMVV